MYRQGDEGGYMASVIGLASAVLLNALW